MPHPIVTKYRNLLALKVLFAHQLAGVIIATFKVPKRYKLIMSMTGVPMEVAKQLAYIENKYDIFFKVNNRQLSDYLELEFVPQPAVKLKGNHNLPFPLVNELKKDFLLLEQ